MKLFKSYYGNELDKMYFSRNRVVGAMEDRIREEQRKEKKEQRKRRIEDILKDIKKQSQELDTAYKNTVSTNKKPKKVCVSRKKKKRITKQINYKHYRSFIKGRAITLNSENSELSGKWRAKRLIKFKKRIKNIIANNYNFQENILLLKAYSTLLTPKLRKGYKRKRASTVSHLKEPTKCVVCKTNEAYCNHHIHLLVNGGGNEDYNLIPICFSCHKRIHEWLQ